MKEFAKAFYNSPGWKRTRQAYARSVGGLCEPCMKRGLFNAGEIVHHKIVLTPENIDDPTVTLNWNNLELVCRECHAAYHERSKKRFKIDSLGRVSARI